MMRTLERLVSALELKVPPPVVALLIAAGMYLISRVTSSISLLFAWRACAAAVMVLVGVALAISGSAAFKRNDTNINPLHPERTSSLVVSGVFRFTRNPMYLGLLVNLLGLSVLFGSAFALLGPLCFFLYIARFQIAPEEKMLRAKFGEAYSDYVSKVRRWL
jgi:protein-S-isoprenylcysteine O-methyltransferase Ste14